MKTSADGIALIKHFEGLRLTAYRDSVGVLTIGYGHTGKDITEGLVIDEPRAEYLLAHDLIRFEDGVERCVHVPIQQNQFDALVSFTFNLGVASLEMSTLLKLLNHGDYAGASREFGRWTKAGGHELPGLVKRRAAEAAMFRGGDWQNAS